MTETIKEVTVEKGLCVSCGICAGACPVRCISFQKREGQYLPVIDNSKCIQCGVCADVCPSSVHGENYSEYARTNQCEWTEEEYLWGSQKGCFSAYCKDSRVRDNAVSGGIVTTMVSRLLSDGAYDAAFIVGENSYEAQVETRKYTVDMSMAGTAKSRYVPVSHAETIYYMRKHPKEKLIITGTSCAVHGILRAIDRFQLNRCLYCLDKLNQFADISFGDDYVNREKSLAVNGRSLVILRTKAGKEAFQMIQNDIVSEPVSLEEIKKSQGIEKRKKNCAYAVIARDELGTQWYPFLKQEVSEERKKEYMRACETLEMGMNYPDSAGQIRKRNAEKERKLFFRKLLAKIKG